MARHLPKSEPERTREVARRFWLNVDQRSADQCWLWIAGKDANDEYGRAYDGKRTRQAHALALELILNRSIRDNYQALHHCDNPPCCNPKHLYEGTIQQNVDDAVARNRQFLPYRDFDVPLERRPFGVRNGMRTHPETIVRGKIASDRQPNKTLTVENVVKIRRDYANGRTLTELARQHGVGAPQIHRIVNRQRWAWLPDEGIE